MALDVEDSDESRLLPVIEPLSHHTPLLDPIATESFNVDAFLLSRASHHSLPELRTELRDYLALLKSELVQLINDDYASFISLSTDLRGEGARLEHVKRPLRNIHAQIQESKNDLQSMQNDVQAMLTERIAIREEKALLHLLLKISEAITRMESLLYISTESPLDEHLAMNFKSKPQEKATAAKGLSRLVSEFSHLDYLMQKVHAEKCLLAEAFQPRVSRIKDTLSHDISTHFASVLRRKPLGEMERTRKLADTEQCLKYYVSLGICAEGERMMRQEVMQDFIKKNIFPTALNAPPSPVVPHTPLFPAKNAQRFPPGTPFTPFQQPVSASMSTPSVALLLEDGNPLAFFYNGILRFIDREFRAIITICERLSSSYASQRQEQQFEVLSNVIWDELGRAIMDELGGTIFASGKPDEFQRNYIATQEFLSSLESFATTSGAVLSFRNHRTYREFDKRWQLSIYFQLRWKTIVGPLDETLTGSPSRRNRGDVYDSGDVRSKFRTSQALATYNALRTCWAGDIYIPSLAWKFWRLSLQIILRHHSWLSGSLPMLEVSKPISAPDSRIGSSEASADPAHEDSFLRQASITVHDTLYLLQAVEQLWQQQISVLLTSVEPSDSIHDALNSSMNKISSNIEPLSATIVTILSRRACDGLQPLRHVLSQFRTMPSKKLPSRPSDFVLTVMKPVHSFFGDDNWAAHTSSALQKQYEVEWSTSVFDSAVARFTSMLATMRQNEASLRRLKRGKKATFPLFGGGGSSVASSDDNADEERMKSQLLLNITALGEDAKRLGVDVDNHDGLKRLYELASTRYDDG